MSFILSMSFFYLFTKKLYRITSAVTTLIFFAPLRGGYICPLYYQYCNWENPYKKDTAVDPSCQPLFFKIYVPMLSLIFCTFLSQYSTFFNAHAHLFINCPLNANQSVYICYKYLLKRLNKAILSTF